MLTVLVTGFEPFGGSDDNPSLRAVQALAAAPQVGVRLHTTVLPVTYAAAGPALRAALARHRPDLLLATGLAGGRVEICVERVALNVDDAPMADNAGELRIDQPVVRGGPAAYFATIPIKAVVAAIRRAGVPARVSQTAGTFLCNHVFYLASHLAATTYPGLAVGFLHLPWLPELVADHPGQPSMALATMLTGLRAAIDAAARTEADIEVAEGATS
jgi:pyroglutamyl-peptidase